MEIYCCLRLFSRLVMFWIKMFIISLLCFLILCVWFYCDCRESMCGASLYNSIYLSTYYVTHFYYSDLMKWKKGMWRFCVFIVKKNTKNYIKTFIWQYFLHFFIYSYLLKYKTTSECLTAKWTNILSWMVLFIKVRINFYHFTLDYSRKNK